MSFVLIQIIACRTFYNITIKINGIIILTTSVTWNEVCDNVQTYCVITRLFKYCLLYTSDAADDGEV